MQDTNISNDMGIQLTHFADDTQDLIFSLGRINGSIVHWFDKNSH